MDIKEQKSIKRGKILLIIYYFRLLINFRNKRDLSSQKTRHLSFLTFKRRQGCLNGLEFHLEKKKHIN